MDGRINSHSPSFDKLQPRGKARRLRTRAPASFEIEPLESRTLLSNTLSTRATFPFSSGFGDFAGGSPSRLVIDGSGNLYGVITENNYGPADGIFEIPAGGDAPEVIISSSYGPDDVAFSVSGDLSIDSAGNIYGTATVGQGGTAWDEVFEIPHGTTEMNSLATFPVEDTGGALAMDSGGNLYGVAHQCGDNGTGYVYEVVPSTENEFPLASFPADFAPTGGLVIDSGGNLYGTLVGNTGYTGIWELPAGSTSIAARATMDDFGDGELEEGLLVDHCGNIFGVTGALNESDLSAVVALGAGATA